MVRIKRAMIAAVAAGALTSGVVGGVLAGPANASLRARHGGDPCAQGFAGQHNPNCRVLMR